ncbi:MAG TPA: ABC transporter substrate-binding protein [Stellaceae bacterium]|jgi:branched-chain amino acid transport system substrate-binding protein|nr:ABC transporter substrate-binding protein [Stellaceae bacterium]
MFGKSWIAGFAALGLLTALGGGAVRAADAPVVVGLEIPLSPPGDPVGGQLIRRGAELAVDYVNKEMKGVDGGKQIALSVEDTQGRTEAGVAGYRKLVSEDHAVAVTGFFHSSVNIAVNEVAHQLGVPTIGTQTSAADVTAKHYPEAFRTHAIDPIRAATWLELVKNKGWKKVSLLAETTDYGIGLVEETKKQNETGKLGLDIQAITFDHATTDLTPQLLQIKAFKPDVLINIGVGQPADLMLDQATTIGLTPATPMLISYDAPVRPQFWQLHAKDGAGVYFIAYYSPQQKLSDIGAWFAKAYQAKYNEAPTYGSLNGFGDVAIIAEAIDRAKSIDPKAVTKALGAGTFKSWADAPVTFPAADGVYYHNWSPPILILQYTKSGQDWKDATIAVEHKNGK